MLFISIGDENLWVSSNLLRSDLTRKDLLRILAMALRGRAKKDYRTGDTQVDPLIMGTALRLDEI